MSTDHIPTSDLSQKELQSGYWVATHRARIRMLGIIMLSVIVAVSVGVFMWTTAQWLLHRTSTEQIEQYLLTQPVDYTAISHPKPLQNVRSFALKRDDAHVDVVIEVSNPNTTWAAVDHVVEVVVGGQSAGSATVSLAPGQLWYLTRLNVPWTDPNLPHIELTTHDLQWRRMPDVDATVKDTWEYTDASFGYVDSVASHTLFQSELSFTARNTSIVGFREPEVVVFLQDDSGTPVAVGSIVLSTIDSLESRTIHLLWPQRYSRSLTPVIHVNVDKINEDRMIRPTIDGSS